MARQLPAAVRDVEQLEELLSEPSPEAIAAMERMEGDLILLGAGGKMGPTLARMAVRASAAAGRRRRVIGVSRFGSPGVAERLAVHGVETIRCDLTDRAAVDALPDVPNVLGMIGMKFGSTGNEPQTWMTNVFVPGTICEKFRHSRLVVFSTGNVYPLVAVTSAGSREGDAPRPVGEYAMTALGRERICTGFSQACGFPLALLRLNYANELRYGVLVDLARSVWEGQPVSLAMGYFNAIWQGDASAMALAAFDHAVPGGRVINLAGVERLSVREVAAGFARRFGKPLRLSGTECEDALLSDGTLGRSLCGPPRVDEGQMIEWIADWVQRGGASLNKPTHFAVRDGVF
jgi:nucleoside-diphosphate-sugar epimerase